MSLAMIRNRAKLISLVLVLGFGLVFVPAVNAVESKQECEAQGGIYANDQGTKSCTITTTPGNNQGGVTKTNETEQKGSFSSSHPRDEEDCVNNGGGSHCK
jgi:hypothetical protein